MYDYGFPQNLANTCALLPAAAITATTTSSAVDLTTSYLDGSGFLLVNVGATATLDASNYFTLKLTDGDTSAAADTPSSTIYGYGGTGGTWNRVISVASKTYLLGINPTKRYLKVVLEETGTASAQVTVNVLHKSRGGIVN